MIQTLLVEDDPTLANLALLRLAKREDIEVFHAADGVAAMDYLDEHHPDLILLDINIPLVDGWDVLKYARETYGNDGIKVIVTTARKDMVSRAKGEIEMVDSYLIKPFTGTELLQTIDEVLGPQDDESEDAESPAEADNTPEAD